MPEPASPQLHRRRPSPAQAKPHAASNAASRSSADGVIDSDTPRITNPPPARLRDAPPALPTTPTDSDHDSELEATELRPTHIPSGTSSRTSSAQGPVQRFWRRWVRASVPHVDCRDHLANERTFLAYLRTSLSLSMISVLIAQLYRLQHSPAPSDVYGYFLLGKPLAGVFQCLALITVVLGAVRFLRQQNAMARGRIRAKGVEIWVIGVGMGILLFAVLVLLVAVDIFKSDEDEL